MPRWLTGTLPQPLRIEVIDRSGGGVVSTTEVEPFFVFHHVNAYERKGKVVLDVCAYPDASIMGALYLKRLRRGRKVPRAGLRRIEVDPARRRATQRDLVEPNFELPRVDYDTANGRPYRYAFGVGLRGPNSRFVDQLVKADVRRGEALTWHDPGTFPGEPIFVRRPGGRRDDDGVVLSVLLDAGRRSSALVVLDAGTMEEVARASVPHHIPFGFHGVYAR